MKLYRALIVLIFAFLLLTGCSPKLELTPVTSPATGVHHQGKFVWHDLLTPDVATAKKFYGELFGWSFKEQGRYTVILNNGQAIGGIVKIQPKDNKDRLARWLTSLSVADVDQAAAFVQKSGGIIHEGPVEMKNRGRGVRRLPLIITAGITTPTLPGVAATEAFTTIIIGAMDTVGVVVAEVGTTTRSAARQICPPDQGQAADNHALQFFA
ncbi:MAG: VOC family protein [Pseudomonadota bacterium]|nr:VOC family protein [Pseudomonadota bacterium]